MVADGEDTVVQTEGVTPAESPPAEGVETSSLDAVMAALAPKEASPTSETGDEQPPAKETVEKPSDAEPDPETGISKAELNRYSPNAQNRIRELAARKNELGAEVESLKPKAERFDAIANHLRTHDIAPQEFDNAIEVTRLIKHEPDRALEVLIPLVQELARKTGRYIPPDLQERVRLGHLSEQDAQRVAQAEARERLAAERSQAEQRRREQADQERQQRVFQERVTNNALAVDQWAKQKAATDPDWAKKQPLLTKEFELELRRAGVDGYPKNGAESVALAERVLKAVDDHLKTFAPKPQQIKPVNGMGASPRNTAQPKTAQEAVLMSLGIAG